MQLTQRLLPHMREQHYGRVITVGSMLASFPLAHRGSYCAAKAALRGSPCRLVRSFFAVRGVGRPRGTRSIATGIGERRTHYIADDSPYRHDYDTMIAHLDANEKGGITPARSRRPW